MKGVKSHQGLAKKVNELNRILTREYGRKEIHGREDPLDTLIETILSQNTTDVNSHRSFEALRQRYDSWHELMADDPLSVAEVIRSGGLAEIKARRIIGALKHIQRTHGCLDLEFLRTMSPDEADSWLSEMKGVGPKTRSIVMLFSLNMPAFPVDTHIHRVSKRLGLIGHGVSRESAQDLLAEIVPSREYFNFHVNLIEHGRQKCRARNPLCGDCRVSHLCEMRQAQAKP